MLVRLAKQIVEAQGWPGDDAMLTKRFQQRLRHSAHEPNKGLKRKRQNVDSGNSGNSKIPAKRKKQTAVEVGFLFH